MPKLSFLELTDDCLIEILNSLTKKDLLTLTQIIRPERMKNLLRRVSFKRLKVCPWTFLMGMKNLSELASANNLNYVSKFCQNLIINTDNRNYRRIGNLTVLSNENIQELHIDIPNSGVGHLELKCPNLKKLTFVYYRYLNDAILQDIIQNCPKLERINIFFSGEISEDFTEHLGKNTNILLKIR